MAAVYSDALGKFGQPPLWPFHHVGRELDLAALVAVPCHAARHQGRGRQADVAGRQSICRPWLALQSVRCGGTRLVVLCGGGF